VFISPPYFWLHLNFETVPKNPHSEKIGCWWRPMRLGDFKWNHSLFGSILHGLAVLFAVFSLALVTSWCAPFSPMVKKSVNSWRMRVLPWVKKCRVLDAQILFQVSTAWPERVQGLHWPLHYGNHRLFSVISCCRSNIVVKTSIVLRSVTNVINQCRRACKCFRSCWSR
jgi:hypothetical protein